MKTKTLNTLIKDLPTTGDACGFIRQLAGVDSQKYRDAHRCTMDAREDAAAGFIPNNIVNATKTINYQKAAVVEFVKKYSKMTVREYFELKGIEYFEGKTKKNDK